MLYNIILSCLSSCVCGLTLTLSSKNRKREITQKENKSEKEEIKRN